MVDAVALEDIEVPLWGLGDSPVGAVALSTALDWAGRETLAALGEVGLPRTPGAHPYRCERDQLALEAALQAWLGKLIGAWYRAIPGGDLDVAFFELLRDWCYQIYNETIAYSTVECFVEAISATLKVADGSAAPEDRDLLDMMEQFLRLLLDDAAIFRGVSRASTDAVVAAVEPANERVANMLALFRDVLLGWVGASGTARDCRFEPVAENVSWVGRHTLYVGSGPWSSGRSGRCRRSTGGRVGRSSTTAMSKIRGRVSSCGSSSTGRAVRWARRGRTRVGWRCISRGRSELV